MQARERSALILLVEDDPTFGTALRRLLEMDGHRVVQAMDGDDALRLLREPGPRIDLVLCDLLLPRRSGFEVVKEMNALGLEIPVLAMTGVYERPREIHALRGLGVKGYIHKSSPFDHFTFRVKTLLHPETAERRSYRVTAAIPVEFEIGDRTCYATTYNLSATGLYVRSSEVPEPGALLEISMRLPTAREMLHVRAEVVHAASVDAVKGTSYPAGFGARFLDLSQLGSAAVCCYVDSVRAEETMGAPDEVTAPEPVPAQVCS